VTKRSLRMRKLTRDEIGIARQNQIYMFSPSPDPYVTAVLNVDAQPLLDLIAARRESSGKPITMVHVFNKMLGMAFKEHPAFNSLVLDRRVFELENVTISNPFLLPGDERALTMLLVQDPQDKSLEEISDFFEAEKQVKREEYAKYGQTRIGIVPKLYVRSGLYKVISEKMQFKMVYERSLTTNLVLSKANNEATKNFFATKGATQILRAFQRFFQHAIVQQPHFENGQWIAKPVVPLTMVLDHRLVDGFHVNAFIATINQIAANAANRL
jgi:pyruvate/2-oxoglutarate dehydrogenase complex dihydrolipoamide acyltransferase (E2) component